MPSAPEALRIAFISPAPPEALAQLVLVPSDFKYLLAALAWLGRKALRAVLAVVCPLPPLAIGRVPVTPVVKGRPVALVRTRAVGVPSAGVTKVGDVENTNAPLPVSSVTAAARLALEGVPKKVVTPEPRLLRPVPPLATGRVPVTPLERGTLVIVLVEPSMDLLVRVSVELIVGIATASSSSLLEAFSLRMRSAPLAAFLQPIPSLFANLSMPVVEMLELLDFK